MGSCSARMKPDTRTSSGIARWQTDGPVTGTNLRTHPPYLDRYSPDFLESQMLKPDCQCERPRQQGGTVMRSKESAVWPYGRKGKQVLITLGLFTFLPLVSS